MAYLYRKNRSPYWYIQYFDSERTKHDKSTGLRTDDPNDTAKAKVLRAELEAQEQGRIPVINGAAWDSWVPKFFDRHCQTEATLGRRQLVAGTAGGDFARRRDDRLRANAISD